MESTHSHQYRKSGQNFNNRKRKLCNDVNGGNRNASRSQHRRKHHVKNSNVTDNVSHKVLEKITCSVCNIGDPKYKCPKCRSTYCSIVCCRKHKGDLCLAVVDSTKSFIDNETSIDTSQNDGQHINFRSKYISDVDLTKCRDGAPMSLTELQKNITDDSCIDAELDPEWKLTNEMILSMKRSTWLREELSDVGLQQLIIKILSSSNNLISSNRSHRYNSSQSQQNTNSYREEMLLHTKSMYPQFQNFVDKLLYLTGIYELRRQDDAYEKLSIDERLMKYNDNEFSLKPLAQRVRSSNGAPPEPSSSSDTSSACSEEDSNEDDDDDDDDSDR
jgi:zinc finger HIT domain-containing protein 3